MNVFLIRPSDLGEALAETGQAIAALAARSAATQLVILCPDQTPVADLTPLAAPLSGLANVDLVTTEQLAALYPVGEIFDPSPTPPATSPTPRQSLSRPRQELSGPSACGRGRR